MSNDQHKEAMKDAKATMDDRIKGAKDKKGLILILTGDGKGKSSSGFGMVARSLGHKMHCGVVQFIKGAFSTGEERFFKRFPEEVEYHVMGEGYTWETQNRDQDIAAAERGWAVAQRMLRDPKFDLVLLDELNIVLDFAYLDIDQVIVDLLAKPPMQHVVITGRGAPQKLIDIADTVSEIQVIKHAFDQGITAQKGVEL